MPERMGNFVLALLLEQAHHLNAYAESQRRREWVPLDAIPLPERCVVLGTGATAAGIAAVLGRHGIDVVGVNRSGTPANGFRVVHAWEVLDRALDGCQLLVLALPATPSTRGIVNDQVLGLLSSAQVVNVGRGSTLDLRALEASLGNGSVTRAHLDVFAAEPPDPDIWLWNHPAVRMTPHVAALTTVDDVVEAIVGSYQDLTHRRTPALLVGDMSATERNAAHRPSQPLAPSPQVVAPVGQEHLDGLMNLFRQAWWTRPRSRERVASMLDSTPATVGLLSAQGELIAFARAISDSQFKAVVVDVIVDQKLRDAGLGHRIMAALLEHPALIEVDEFELYCDQDLASFYRELGFTQPERTIFMRRPRDWGL